METNKRKFSLGPVVFLSRQWLSLFPRPLAEKDHGSLEEYAKPAAEAREAY